MIASAIRHFDFNPDNIRQQQVGAADTIPLAEGKRGVEHGRCRMREQAVNGFFRGRKLGIVVIHRVRGYAVNQRRLRYRKFEPCAQHGRLSAAAHAAGVVQYNARAFFGLAGQRNTQPVEHETLRQADNFGGQISVAGLGNKTRYFFRHGHSNGCRSRFRRVDSGVNITKTMRLSNALLTRAGGVR